jgi:hypothetical protein
MTKMDPSPQRHGRKVKVDVDGHIRKTGHSHGHLVGVQGSPECDARVDFSQAPATLLGAR